MKNNKLAIAIPTYNRSAILNENILLMLEELKRYSIPVYISDDSTNNETKKNYDELKKEYDYIYYYKNQPSLGHDKNCIRTLSLPTEDYIWYLGDSMIIKTGGIKKVLDKIENQNFDFVSVNAEGRILDLASQVYTDGNKLFGELCWHLTLTGATIYSNKIQKQFENFDLVKCKNFPQTALIFEDFAVNDSQLFWINEKLIYVNENKKSYWSNAVFDVFLKDFSSFVFNLPEEYLVSSKITVVSNHSVKTGVFSYFSFINYRIEGYYDCKIFFKYRKKIKKYTENKIYILLIIALFPRGILKYISNMYQVKS